MASKKTAAPSSAVAATGRLRAYITEALPFVLVATAYAIFGSHQIELPGVYMDAVNPDYLAVRVLNWNGYPIPAWVLPGNYLFHHIAILTQLYHGTQQMWLGLPLFWLFGTTVVGLRVTHMLFALGVLGAVYTLLRATTGSRFWAAGACLALAVDPVLVYAFRTQSYITMFPSAWLLLSVLATTRVEAATARAAPHLMFGCGLLLGLAIYGYFVYAFYGAAIAVAAGLAARARSRRGDGVAWRRLMAAWCYGFAVGIAPYVLGYLLIAGALGGMGKLLHAHGYFVFALYGAAIAIAAALAARARSHRGNRVAWRPLMATGYYGFAVGIAICVLSFILIAGELGGVGQLFEYIATGAAHLDVFASGSPYGGRLSHVTAMITAVFGNSWHHEILFAERVSMIGAPLKIAIVLGVPSAIWAFLEFRRQSTVLLRLLLGLQASFFAVALFFGGRLWGHHYMSLVPLAYAALAVALARLAKHVANARVPVRYAFATLVLALVCVNIGGEVLESRTLARTHGVGLYSDAINRFASDVARDPTTVVVMPDWGLMMPVVFLTGARVELTDNENLDLARTRLCQGRDVALALITGDRAARIDGWRRELAGLVPEIADYRQADGNILFQVARFRTAAATAACRDGRLRVSTP